MAHQSMTSAQQSKATAQAVWPVANGEAFQLEIGPGPRELHVTEGRLWLTRRGSAKSPAEDLWLQAGDTIALESGSLWVAEGWGPTAFQLLVPPHACAILARKLKALKPPSVLPMPALA